jgi:hypothetical protein
MAGFGPSFLPGGNQQIINQPPQPPGFSIFDNAQTGVASLRGFGQFGGGPTGPATGPFGPTNPNLEFDQTQQFERTPFDPNTLPGFSSIGNNTPQKMDLLNQHGIGAFGPAIDRFFQRHSGFGGLGKNGPQAGANPFQPQGANPFLTGGANAFGNNNLLTGSPSPASPFRGGVGTRQAGRGLLNRGSNRGGLQVR